MGFRLYNNGDVEAYWGFPYLKTKQKFIGFWFLVSGLLVSTFLSSKDSKTFHVFKRYLLHITNFPLSCFLIDIEFISMIFEIVFNHFALCSGPYLHTF